MQVEMKAAVIVVRMALPSTEMRGLRGRSSEEETEYSFKSRAVLALGGQSTQSGRRSLRGRLYIYTRTDNNLSISRTSPARLMYMKTGIIYAERYRSCLRSRCAPRLRASRTACDERDSGALQARTMARGGSMGVEMESPSCGGSACSTCARLEELWSGMGMCETNSNSNEVSL